MHTPRPPPHTHALQIPEVHRALFKGISVRALHVIGIGGELRKSGSSLRNPAAAYVYCYVKFLTILHIQGSK